MARSLIVLNSRDRGKVSKQLMKVKRALNASGLKAEGPFKDNGDTVTELVKAVRRRMDFSEYNDPVSATLATLSPQNMDGRTSWLKTPFMLGTDPLGMDLDMDFDSAGAIARTRITTVDDHSYREVDIDSLTVLAVAVLRMQDVPAFLAYQHPDESHPAFVLGEIEAALVGFQMAIRPATCILVMDGEMEVHLVHTPYFPGFPEADFAAAIEVLDDEAVSAFMKIKMAYHRTVSLMQDVTTRGPQFHGEGDIRAVEVGHLLYEGTSSWTTEAAEDSVEDAEALAGTRTPVTSVRTIAESRVVHEMICPGCHVKRAIDTIVPEDERSLLGDIVTATCEKDLGSLQRALKKISGSEAIGNLVTYLQLAVEINKHVHPPDGCERVNGSSGN
jgi:hypothetical protein